MRLILIIIMLIFLFSCNSSRKITHEFYFVEPFKEQEVIFSYKDDLTFRFQDKTGCNQFDFTGRYVRAKGSFLSYLIFDSVKLQSVLSKSTSNLVFSIKSGDTAVIINRERILIDKASFKLTSNSNVNLQEIRYKKIKGYYIDLLGREGFIKTFGDGKGMREAKKRLLSCQLPTHYFKLINE